MMSISRLTRIAQIACVALSLASPATRAAAKLCGDDVNGQDIPCACGDILASSVVLGDDPVTTEVCPRDGLLVRAQDERSAIRLDLHGHTLRGSEVFDAQCCFIWKMPRQSQHCPRGIITFNRKLHRGRVEKEVRS